MKRVKALVSSILIFAMVLTTSTGFATSKNSDEYKNHGNIPSHIQDLIQAKENEVNNALPEVKAWEVDLAGNVTEVVPLSDRIGVQAPPNDGFVYTFSHYDLDRTSRDWHYRSAGTVRIQNDLSVPGTYTYEQQNNTTVNWSVSSSISGNTTIGNSFIGKIEYEMGISVGRSKTWSKGTKYGVSQTLPAKSIVYITNYAVAVEGRGSLVYEKRSPAGSLLGYYYENAGGWTISQNDSNIVITATEPL